LAQTHWCVAAAAAAVGGGGLIFMKGCGAAAALGVLARCAQRRVAASELCGGSGWRKAAGAHALQTRHTAHVTHASRVVAVCGCVCARPQVSQLLLLDNQDATKDIKLFINSPGACVAWCAGGAGGA
jgi:hypothetical protein